MYYTFRVERDRNILSKTHFDIFLLVVSLFMAGNSPNKEEGGGTGPQTAVLVSVALLSSTLVG